jgi:hypothetical protein
MGKFGLTGSQHVPAQQTQTAEGISDGLSLETHSQNIATMGAAGQPLILEAAPALAQPALCTLDGITPPHGCAQEMT